MSSHQVVHDKILVRINGPDPKNRPLEFHANRFDWIETLVSPVTTLDYMNTESLASNESRTEHQLDITLGDLSQNCSDAHRLALAVLAGDVDGALALSDEVQMRHAQGEKFVSRKELLAELEKWKKWSVRTLDDAGAPSDHWQAMFNRMRECGKILARCNQELSRDEAPLPTGT